MFEARITSAERGADYWETVLYNGAGTCFLSDHVDKDDAISYAETVNDFLGAKVEKLELE